MGQSLNYKVAVGTRAIAEIIGVRHDNLVRAMKRLVRKGVIASPTAVQWGSTTRGCDYLFTGGRSKQDAITLVSHMAPEFVTQIEAIAQQIDEPVEVELPVGKAALPPLLVGGMSMTSLDIAELVRSQHANVKISIERLMDRGVIQGIALQELSTPSGQTAKAYVFTGEQGKRDSIVVVAQISPEFTARLVDRWQELEAQVAKPAPVANLNDPAALRNLLLGYTEQVMQLEHQVEVQTTKIAEDAPKVRFYDNVAEATGTQTVQEVGKEFGLGAVKFYRLLRDEKILMGHPNQNVPYQKHIDAGHFEVVVSEWRVQETGEVKLKPRPLVTAKGFIYLERRLNKLGHFRKDEK